MTLHVLLVEDDLIKLGKVRDALIVENVDGENILHAASTVDAINLLRARRFDLMLLDINIPRRLGENSLRGEGLSVLRELSRSTDCYRPRYIVGLTAFEDVISEFGTDFDEHLWSLVYYSETSDKWLLQLKLKVEYLNAIKKSENFSDGVTWGIDLAIITALDSVELGAVHKLPLGWQPLRLHHDETRYSQGIYQNAGRNYSVVAAAAPRMGMPASAVLASKLIHQFRPRYLVMIGICAGRAEKVNIGDLIVADPTWDWGSGKIISEGNRPKFLPSPHQLDIDIDLLPKLKNVADDKARLARIKQQSVGTKPSSELNVHFGPLVSGSSVVADMGTFGSLLFQHRGILGLDMEAYGVVAAARGNGKPRPTSLVIKGVCDYADMDKSDDFQEYAASVAANFLYDVMPEIL